MVDAYRSFFTSKIGSGSGERKLSSKHLDLLVSYGIEGELKFY